MTTIELTPDIVFERADGVVSPQPAYWGPTSTTPRPKSKPKPHGRGYHSLGSATLPTRGRKGATNNSGYGIMISIKDIKGHPFVVLEDKDKQKHMVQAPDNEANSSVVSSEGYNGYTPELEYDDNMSSSDIHSSLYTPTGFKRQATPSPIPRSRYTGGVQDNALPQKSFDASRARSRSVPPGRAAQERKNQRARSVSPPRRERGGKPIDSESIKPVKGLIGFFEATSPTDATAVFPKPQKVNRDHQGYATTSRIREVAGRMNAQRVTSPTSTVSSSLNSSVDVSQNSQKSNLTVTAVDSPTSSGKKPEGRYFALTSPGANTSKGTFTLPKLSSIQKPADYAPVKTPAEQPAKTTPSVEKYGKLATTGIYEPKPHKKMYSPNTSEQKHPRPWETKKKTPYLPSYQRKLESGESLLKTEPKKQTSSPILVETVKSKDEIEISTEKQSGKSVDDSAAVSTHVSKAKFMGPSQMLLNKTRRKRSARKVSTAMSESEYSESEYSDAESLKYGEESAKDEEDVDKEVSSINLMANRTPTPETNEDLIKQLGHRRTPSIKFEKIASEDVTKKAEKDDVVDSAAIDEQRKRANKLDEDLKKANNKISELQKEIAQLQIKLRRAENDIGVKNAENGLLKNEVARLKKDLEEALSSDEEEKQSLLSLQRTLRIAKREKTALEESITLLESQKSTLKSQLQDAKHEREDGEVQIRALRLEIEKLKGRGNEHERDVETGRKELSRVKRQTEAQIQDLEDHLSKAEQKSHDLQLEKAALEKQLYELKHEKLASADQDIHFNETMQQLEQSKLKALKDLEAAHLEIDEKSRALREAERKNNNLQEELRRMDNEMEEELKERESTLAESRRLDQNVKDMKAQQQVTNREIEMLKKELENAKSQDRAADSEMEKLQDLLDEKEVKLESLSKKNRALQKQLDDETSSQLAQNTELGDVTKENEKLMDEVADLKNQLRKAEIELMATKDALDEARKDLHKASEDTEKERSKVSELDNNAQELRDDYDRMRSALEQREVALKNAREAIGKIETQMKDYEESHSQAEREKQQLEVDRDETKREMERLRGQVDSQTKQMGDANKTIKDLREKLADDMKSSLDGIERMTELKKEVQRLQALLDEKSQQVFAAEETIYKQKEVIEEMNAIQQKAKKSALEEMEKFMEDTEKQFAELKTDIGKKSDEIKKLEAEKRELEEELDELEQQNPHYDDDREKEEELVNLSQKLREEEDEKNQLIAKLQMAQDKLGNAHNEIEIERSRVQILLDEKQRDKEETDELHDRIADLEEKLDQEAVELVNIKSHHMKTEMKLRDVLKEAQEETDRAIHEKEMFVVRTNSLEKQVEEAEIAAKRIENSKHSLEQQLQQQIEANYKLQQTLAALGIGHSPEGSDSQSSLLTSV